jgi:hypothetical protein
MKSPESTQSSVEPAAVRLQEHYLSRLHQLIAKREQQLKIDAGDKLSLRLLARALYSTYMDCVASGVGDQASDVLEKAQSRGAPTPANKAS